MPTYNITSIGCLFLLLFTPLSPGAQERYENDTLMAFKYLEERGEVYFSFDASPAEIRLSSLIISVDNFSEGRAYAYANLEEFEAFLKEAIEFTVYSPPGEWYREAPSVKGHLDYYPSYTGYIGMMQAWADEYGDICEYVDVGASVEGRRMVFLKITGNNSSINEKPRFMYSSTMHGDETVGFILMLRLIDYLLVNYPEDKQVMQLIDNLEIWINPLANPDGMYFGGDGNSVVSPKRSNARNIDLNRNFPGPGESQYTTEGREPETVAMMDLMESNLFILSANLHGGEEVINYPWDTSESRHSDDRWFQYIAREYADTAIYYSPPDYMTFKGGTTNGWDWYSVFGGRQDYVTCFTGGREVTMEISKQKHPPASTLNDYWEYNRRSLLNYMEQAMFGIRGRVTDSFTGEDISAKVELLSHDLEYSFVFSDASTGWYFRMLKEGVYDIMFSAEGYKSYLVENQKVWDRDTRRLDVALEPVTTNTGLAGNDDVGLNIFPQPARDIINISVDLPGFSFVEMVLFDQSGRKLKLMYRGWVMAGGNNISLDIADIHPGIYIIGIKYGKSYVTRKVLIYR